MAKPEKGEAVTLAGYWSPPVTMRPDQDGIPGSPGRPVAVIATTYTFHASLFEDDLLPHFLGLRFDPTERERAFVLERDEQLAVGVRAFVLVDAAHFDSGQSTLRWSQLPVRVTNGCQHAKVTVLVWERLIRVLVGSANLTRTGYRRNREMCAAIDFDNHEESAPRELLRDVCTFLEAYEPWLRASGDAVARFRETTEEIRRRSSAWRRMPAEQAGGRPQVTFAPCVPERLESPGGRRLSARRSALSKFVELWGSRSASEVTVMTPFVGTTAESEEPVLASFLGREGIRRTREARGFLVVPGAPSEGDPAARSVDLPRWFLDSWTTHWADDPARTSTFVVSRAPPDPRSPARALHAKALLLSDDKSSLLMMGSSNFSAPGLGVGLANFEANLVYLDAKEGTYRPALEDRLPVDWKKDYAERATWPDEVLAGGEDPADGQLPPLAFVWATLRPRTGTLTLGFDPREPLPARWSVRITSDPDRTVLLDEERLPAVPDPPNITIPLPESLRGRSFASVLVTWSDESNEVHSAAIAVTVDDPSELPLAEELRGLTADGILDCLLSGRDPIEWAEDEEERRGRGVPSAGMLDPLKAVNTSRYALYRVRRFGRALGRVAQRLLSTPRVKDAISYRLHHDPIGPHALADAVVREWQGYDPVYVRFALAELRLCLAHAASRIQADRKTGHIDVRPLFQELDVWLAALSPTSTTPIALTPTLDEYVAAISRQCGALLGVTHGGDSHAG